MSCAHTAWLAFSVQSSDDELKRNTSLWERYTCHLTRANLDLKVWDWAPASGILPCPVYTRHCVLASSNPTVPAFVADSFLQETFLADGQTTLHAHLLSRPELMHEEPPAEFRERYSG